MYEIHFYRDKSGKQPVVDYMVGLKKKKDKDSRIKLNKINDYIQALSVYGTVIGEPAPFREKNTKNTSPGD